ncbi:unnamed protein product [Prunus armeniaca]|uniref:Retrotransposon Copia-like N-terminal domain-containing protein n=1 Tax=Prunus armeniaca TaxID=36596 RepID=A0A6J5WY09_PRUAR|nr:unnamed protein product [Prunus armeniaca]
MGKNSVTPLDLLHNACDYITLKLAETNYVQWTYQVEKFLKVHRLYGFLDGIVVAPTDSNNGDFKEWEAPMDTTILNLIAASLSLEIRRFMNLR